MPPGLRPSRPQAPPHHWAPWPSWLSRPRRPSRPTDGGPPHSPSPPHRNPSPIPPPTSPVSHSLPTFWIGGAHPSTPTPASTTIADPAASPRRPRPPPLASTSPLPPDWIGRITAPRPGLPPSSSPWNDAAARSSYPAGLLPVTRSSPTASPTSPELAPETLRPPLGACRRAPPFSDSHRRRPPVPRRCRARTCSGRTHRPSLTPPSPPLTRHAATSPGRRGLACAASLPPRPPGRCRGHRRPVALGCTRYGCVQVTRRPHAR